MFEIRLVWLDGRKFTEITLPTVRSSLLLPAVHAAHSSHGRLHTVHEHGHGLNELLLHYVLRNL